MTQSNQDVYVSLEFTPNPNTLKYSVNRVLLEKGGAVSFRNAEDAQARSPLAVQLLNVPGIQGVMIGKDFVTVTKTDEGDWDVVHKSTSNTLETYLKAGEPVIIGDASTHAHKGGSTDVENRIRQILDTEIRPAVAMDGGDITFDRFEDGVVYLFLQGSCAGCPSSTATLKMGIETRLRDAIPEVSAVEAI